jgi:hypothetical protein
MFPSKTCFLTTEKIDNEIRQIVLFLLSDWFMKGTREESLVFGEAVVQA